MTKAEIVNSIAQRTGVAKPDVATTIEAFMDEIRTSLAVNYYLPFLCILFLSE